MLLFAVYRFARRAVDANADNLVMPLVEDLLPAATYDAVDEYVDNVLYVKNSKQKDTCTYYINRTC